MADFDSVNSVPPRFSRDEAMTIVRRAIENESLAEGRTDYDWADLMDIGAQCGVREDQILASLHELRYEDNFAENLQRARRAKIRNWFNHTFAFLVVNGAMALLGAMTGTGLEILIPALFWGIGLTFHTRFAWFPSEAALHDTLIELEKADQRREEQRRRLRVGGEIAVD